MVVPVEEVEAVPPIATVIVLLVIIDLSIDIVVLLLEAKAVPAESKKQEELQTIGYPISFIKYINLF